MVPELPAWLAAAAAPRTIGVLLGTGRTARQYAHWALRSTGNSAGVRGGGGAGCGVVLCGQVLDTIGLIAASRVVAVPCHSHTRQHQTTVFTDAIDMPSRRC